MELFKALIIAEAVKAQLAPFCDRIEIAGSIRRKKPEVGDIEIVCVPKPSEILSFIQTAESLGEKVKGDPGGRYAQIVLLEGISLDLFIARQENYGLILAIRTGSADFSHKYLACGWVKHGYKSVDGMLTYRGRPVEVREEIDLFKLIKLENRI
jgi:DNA polymerase/3'-5' exonuclease PolX